MPQHTDERTSRTSPPLDAVAARRAQIRAVAAALVDGPRMSRRFHVPAGVPLSGSPRRRRHGRRRSAPSAEPRRSPTVRRLAAAALLVAQVGILAVLLFSPAFRVRTIDVTGDRLLSRDALLAAARVPQASLFTVDGDAIRARLDALPWVRAVTVSTQLPSTLHISVTEWPPDVLLRHASTNAFVASNGATLPLTAATRGARAGVPLLLDYRSGAQQPLPAGLTDVLASAAQRWPATFGCNLDAFVISASNVLSSWCSSGWQAVFGAMDGTDAVAAIPAQLEVLAALKGKVDFSHPSFGYVDLENPNTPTLGGHPGEPASLHADIAASSDPATALPAGPAAPSLAGPSATTPTAAPSAAPTATPAPTPRPTPTPYAFTLPPPSSAPPGARQ